MAKKKDKKEKKSKKTQKAAMPAFPMPPAPAFPWAPNGVKSPDEVKEKLGEKAQEINSNAKEVWSKSIEMRKASVDGSKEQYTQFVAYMMDMKGGLADSLPEALPTLPGLPEIPFSPKDFMKSVAEFEEMANEYLVEQADSWTGFVYEVQQKVVNTIPDAPKKEDQEEQAEKAEDAEKAEKAEDAE